MFLIKCLIGVLNNVFNSLLESLPKLGGSLYSLTLIINENSYDLRLVESAKLTGKYIALDDHISISELKKIVGEMDIIYSDTWIDMEYFNNPKFTLDNNARVDKMLPYQINEELMLNSKAIVMHDMPMHSGFEISRDTIEKNINTIMLQSENRRHVSKGILLEVNECSMEKFQSLLNAN
ncbi:MAG: hypothetical protein LBF12_07670 [Christensenellaceae bacterium]|nr:hypothetical protein [Christensenellaceae bacterium]